MIHDTIKQRLRAALLSSGPGKSILDTAARLASELDDDGTWTDLTPGAVPVGAAVGGGHLERTFLLARARHLAPGELDGPVRRALDWWLSRDQPAGDWHQDQLATPRLVGEIALLCEDELSLGAWGKVVEILARSRWAFWEPGEGWRDWSGPVLLGVAYNVILRGCLEKMPALCDTAFRRAFKHARWKQPGEEDPANGVQFPPAFAAGDNLSLAQDYTRLITLAYGTPWQAPAESVRSFVGYLLDFLQWTMRQSVPDPDPSAGSFSDAPKLRELAAAIVQLSQLGNPPRREELLALAERLQGRGNPLTGHRSFWRSQVAFHQRPAFYSSLRLKGALLGRPDFAPVGAPAVGSTIYFLRDGQEYAEMREHWNLRQLPGLTAIQRDEGPASHAPVAAPRLSGCVGEGEFGLGALEQDAAGLQARKAWFFLEESVVCLDAGVYGPPANYPVYTTVNQCRFQGGAVAETANRERFNLDPGQAHDLTAVRRVEHGGFLYYFPAPLHVVASIGSTPPALPGGHPVFSLCINHGLKPVKAAAAYVVLPLAPAGATQDRNRAEIAQIEFLANTSAVQAVRHRASGLIGVVFWEPGVLSLAPSGRVAANRPCLLLCRERPGGGATLSISNLSRQPGTVHVEYGGDCVSFDLPGGAEAGRGFSRQL